MQPFFVPGRFAQRLAKYKYKSRKRWKRAECAKNFRDFAEIVNNNAQFVIRISHLFGDSYCSRGNYIWSDPLATKFLRAIG